MNVILQLAADGSAVPALLRKGPLALVPFLGQTVLEHALAGLAAEGVKFVILEPHQAESVRSLSGGAWKPADGLLVPGRPYLWRGAAGAQVALFFYDGALSRTIAFEHAMRDSRGFSRRWQPAW